MMYFFVSIPPNTFFILRPAFSAMSTKLATDLADDIEPDRCAASATSNIKSATVKEKKRRKRRKKENPRPGYKTMLIQDVRGQFAAPSSAETRSPELIPHNRRCSSVQIYCFLTGYSLNNLLMVEFASSISLSGLLLIASDPMPRQMSLFVLASTISMINWPGCTTTVEFP